MESFKIKDKAEKLKTGMGKNFPILVLQFKAKFDSLRGHTASFY